MVAVRGSLLVNPFAARARGTQAQPVHNGVAAPVGPGVVLDVVENADGKHSTVHDLDAPTQKRKMAKKQPAKKTASKKTASQAPAKQPAKKTVGRKPRSA